MNRRCYLQECCNKYGDFKVTRGRRVGDTNMYTKWRSVLECWHSDQGLRFLDTVNNRTSFQCEIVLDLDDDISEAKLNEICRILDSYRFPYRAYFSGSKSYHIHVIEHYLMLRKKDRREKIRAFLIKKAGCDFQLKSENHMIALENVPHWKTGKLKELLRVGKWVI